MRSAIMTFLESARSAQQAEAMHPDLLNPVVGVDYSYALSEDQKGRLHQLHKNIAEIILGLSMIKEVKDAYPGTTSSVCATISSDINASVVIECSLYAPIVAIFSYGNVPFITMQHIIQCVHDIGLIDLQPDEIQELEQEGVWRVLF